MALQTLRKPKSRQPARARKPKIVRRDREMARLQTAANAGDEQAFLAAKCAMDWSARSGDDFMRAVRLALTAGALMAARNLAAEGATQHPEHAELQQAAHILAPPKVIRRSPADPHASADIAWLRQHADEHRNEWVALRNGDLLGSAKSLDALVKIVGDITGVLMTPVY